MVRWSTPAAAPTKPRRAYSTRPGTPLICGQRKKARLHDPWKDPIPPQFIWCRCCYSKGVFAQCIFDIKAKRVAFRSIPPVPYDDKTPVVFKGSHHGLDNPKCFIDFTAYPDIVDDILRFAAASVPNHPTVRRINKMANDNVIKEALGHIDIRLVLVIAVPPIEDLRMWIPDLKTPEPTLCPKMVATYHGTSRAIPFLDIDWDAPPERRAASLEMVKKYTKNVDIVPSMFQTSMVTGYSRLAYLLDRSLTTLRYGRKGLAFPTRPQTYIEFASDVKPFRSVVWSRFNDTVVNVVIDATKENDVGTWKNKSVMPGWDGKWQSIVATHNRMMDLHLRFTGRRPPTIYDDSNITIILTKHNVPLRRPLPGTVMPRWAADTHAVDLVRMNCFQGFKGVYTFVGLEIIDPLWFMPDTPKGAVYKKKGAEGWFLERVRDQLAKCVLDGLGQDARSLRTWWDDIRARIRFLTVAEYRAEVGEAAFALATNVNYALVPPS